MSTSGELGNVRAFRELSRFGRCYVNMRRNNALALIATAPGSREETEAFNRLVFGEQSCLHGGTRMSLPIVFMRGAIAEGLVKSGGVPANYWLPAPSVAEVRTLADVARCYTSGRQDQVRALLEIELGTAEETAAVAALWDDFRGCFPPNFRIRLNAPWIRFLLAEALLRLPPAAPAPSGG
jgi:hypothetical protein